MLSAIWGPAAASPLVSLSLEHIARTPTARLGISYQIVPAYVLDTVRGGPPPGIIPWYFVPLGTGLYLDSLLGGGINGQSLPLVLSGSGTPPLGMTIDVLA